MNRHTVLPLLGLLVAVAAPASGASAGEAGAAWWSLDPALVAPIEEVRATCPSGERRSCGALALHYSRAAARVAADPTAAATVYRLACDDDFAWACFQLAELARQGRGIERRSAAALALQQAACRAGEPRGCLGAGQMFETGDGISADRAAAERIYRRECDASRTAGCWRLGQLLDIERAPADQELRAEVTVAFRSACLGGNGAACQRLAEILETEVADRQRAFLFYGQACDRDHLPGCARFAELLDTGELAPPDPVFVTRLLVRACEGGLLDSCTVLAPRLAAGVGAEADPVRAAAIYDRLCADEGRGAACVALADLLRQGALGPVSALELVRLERRACDLGVSGACAAAER